MTHVDRAVERRARTMFEGNRRGIDRYKSWLSISEDERNKFRSEAQVMEDLIKEETARRLIEKEA
jgi:hypothetical protein